LVNALAEDGVLLAEIDTVMLLRNLDLTFAAVMLNWVLGALTTEELQAAAGYGYALALRGAAADAWRDRLTTRIEDYQALLIAQRRGAVAA